MIILVLSDSELDALTDAVDSAIVDLEDYLISVIDDLESDELKDLLNRWRALKHKLE